MGKIAFVFSGQGAQYSGMGKSLYELGGIAKKLYDDAEVYRQGTLKQSFYGSDEELKSTLNTQPCLYLIDLAAALSLREKGVEADCAAGFSLGELAALAYAGAYSSADGFKIVTERGRLMHEASLKADTAMCAVVKLESGVVSNAVNEFEQLYAVNFNSPGQTVVSGLKSSFPAFEERIRELGGRCIPLPVSAAFHSPFMNEASEAFGDVLKNFSIKTPEIPVYANLTAKPYSCEMVENLKKQMKNPVRWQETIENMIADGCTDFIECGAGRTLCGLIKKISKTVNVYSVENQETLLLTAEAVKANA